jgi:hypothetical protein
MDIYQIVAGSIGLLIIVAAALATLRYCIKYPVATLRLLVIFLLFTGVVLLSVHTVVGAIPQAQAVQHAPAITDHPSSISVSVTPASRPPHSTPTPPTPMPRPAATSAPTIAMPPPAGIYTWATEHAQPAFDDPMSGPSNAQWAMRANNCLFTGSSYLVSAPGTNYYTTCLALAPAYSHLRNFVFQAQLAIDQGDGGGIVFQASPGAFYAFTYCVDSNCHAGNYGLHLIQPHSDTRLALAPSAAIHTAPGAINTLAVVSLNGTLYLYINQQFMTTVNAPVLAAGSIGLTAYGKFDTTVLTCQETKLWLL